MPLCVCACVCVFSLDSGKEEEQNWLCWRMCKQACVLTANLHSRLQSEAEGKTVFKSSSVIVLFMAGEAGRSPVRCQAARRDCGFSWEKNLVGKHGFNRAATLFLAGALGVGWQATAS